MTKEEKIKEAYGEYWEDVKDFVDENGWVFFSDDENALRLNFHQKDNISTKKTDVDSWRWRPKSLEGIENNNGWIKIESENDLPKTFCSCWVKVGEVVINVPLYYHLINKTFTDNLITQEWNHFTHYQAIIKPEPPLY